MDLLKKLPMPITGLTLGLFALGNLLQSYSAGLRLGLGFLSLALLIIFSLKCILLFDEVKKSLENPVIASVFPTFSMAIMLLSTYLKPFNQSLAFVIWLLGVIMHIILMYWFTRKFVLAKNYNIKKVFPSWFIPYVGIAVASVAAPAVGMQAAGRVIFWFALVSFIVLFPIVLKRVFIVKEIPDGAKPCFGILAAPVSLCLVGYLNSFANKNFFFVCTLLFLSQILYWMVLIYLPVIIKNKFVPSYAGYTFPLVITGIAIKLSNNYILSTSRNTGLLSKVVQLEEFIALFLCVYVLYKYLQSIFRTEK